jgi:HK97 gp10 family phage protein
MPAKKYYKPTGGRRGGSKRGSHKNAGFKEYKHIQQHYGIGKGINGLFKIWDMFQKRDAKAAAGATQQAARPKSALGRWLAAAMGKGRHNRGKHGRISVYAVCRFLEFGTHDMSKKPFITAAFKSVETKARDAMIAKLREGLDQACR